MSNHRPLRNNAEDIAYASTVLRQQMALKPEQAQAWAEHVVRWPALQFRPEDPVVGYTRFELLHAAGTYGSDYTGRPLRKELQQILKDNRARAVERWQRTNLPPRPKPIPAKLGPWGLSRHEGPAKLILALMERRPDLVREHQEALGDFGDRLVYEFDRGAAQVREAEERNAHLVSKPHYRPDKSGEGAAPSDCDAEWSDPGGH